VGAPTFGLYLCQIPRASSFFLLDCLIKLYDCRIVDILTDQTPLSLKNSVSRETDEMGSDGVEDPWFHVERGFQQIVTQFGQKPSLRDPSADPCSKPLFHVKQNSLAIAPKFVSRETGVSPIANSVRESLFYVKRVVVQLSLCRASAR
jgi:hypothetical protein